MRTVLQLTLPVAGTAPDALDLWRMAPGQRDAGDGDVTIWRAELPRQAGQAGAILIQEASVLRIAKNALPIAEMRLAQAARSRWQGEQPDHEASSFGPRVVGQPDSGLELGYAGSQAERQLLGQLDALEQAAGGTQSFAPGSPLFDLEALSKQARAFLEKLRRALADFAWVDTCSGERWVARTSVSWLGDFETSWSAGLTPAQRQQHLYALRIAIETRQTWLRIGLIAAAGAARLSATLASGVGAIAAVPITLKFIRDLIAEYQRIAQ
jgi:hypothetical protein